MKSATQWTLFNPAGKRKYLCASETPRFLKAAAQRDTATQLFCYVLAFTGCRISEALAVTPSHLDAEIGRVIFRTLKRRSLMYRAVPIPPWLMTALIRLAADTSAETRIWPWSRQTAWRRIKEVMAVAKIEGPQAAPKGLRHGFCAANAEAGVPMPTTRDWVGHADIATTAIYQQAVGEEENAFAQRLWRKWRASLSP
ncbi:MAG TPA: tyrosine-type recombinase/integrase [Rhizomicrobium sp.]